MTSANFTSNMPSARYCAGFVIQRVKPLSTWKTSETQRIVKEAAEGGIGNARKEPEQAQADDSHEADDYRSPERVNGQRDRPAGRLIDHIA